MASASVELRPGATIGPYELIERAGVGGMAEVWRACQTTLDRYVAIKIILRQYATQPDFVARFRREALAISRLDHPNILPIYDFGEQDGFPYMVMPFVAGGTLAQRLGQPWPLREIPPIVEQLGGALDFAHARGIVHRDVKPSNVLLTDQGRAVLSDFGVARMIEEASGLTQAETAVGTPRYMAPEQAAGQPAEPASDLYALAVIAYELLTGRLPFSGETPVAVALAHVHQPLPPARGFNPGLPEPIEAILARALAKDPRDRYPSGTEFARVLARVAGAGPEAETMVVDLRPQAGRDVRTREAPIPRPPERTRVMGPQLDEQPTRTQVAWSPPAPRGRRPARAEEQPYPEVSRHRSPPPARPGRGPRSYGGLLALALLALVLFAAAILGMQLLSSAVQPPADDGRAPTVVLTSAPEPTAPATTPPVATAAAVAPLPAPTASPAPTAAVPLAPAGLDALLQADRARVAGLGFSPGPHAVAPFGQGENLIAIRGTCSGSTDGSCQQVFFFVDGRYLGTDTLKTSTSIGEITPGGSGQIRVTYANYAPSDPVCCPSRAPVTITYTWNGQRLTPDGTPPGH